MAVEAEKELDATPPAQALAPQSPAKPPAPPSQNGAGTGAQQQQPSDKQYAKPADSGKPNGRLVLEDADEEASPEMVDAEKHEFERKQMNELAVYSAKCLWLVERALVQNQEMHDGLHTVKEWYKQLSGDGGSSGHVMISYSWSCKKDFVVKLAEKLKAKQVPVWRDEDQLRFGCNLQVRNLQNLPNKFLIFLDDS